MKRRKAIYRGLQIKPVWLEDKSLTSPDYFQISEFPNRLTSGKNLFKLRGHPSNLRIGGYLDIEVLDYNGDPIYYEVVNYLDEDKSRVIAIYIYEDTSPGDCTITLLAEAQNVPTEWRGQPNVRWSRTIPINPTVSNDSEIIFEKIPTVTIQEQIGPHLDRIYSGSIQFPTHSIGTIKYFSYNGQPAIELSGSKFTEDMSTGILTVTTPINATPAPVYTPDSLKYQSTIKKILSPTLALLDTEYMVYTSASLTTHIYKSFDASSYQLSYEAAPIYVETQNSESYALVEIKGLQPATGDISRIKMFMNNKGTVGTWELINDVELQETEIFVTSATSLYPDTSVGFFTSQSIIDTYWEGHTYQGFNETSAPTLTWSTASLNNAMRIQNSIDISEKNTVTVVQIKSAYPGTFVKNSDYKIILDALGTRTNTDNPRLSLYLSGSAFAFDSTDYFNRELPKILGKRVGELEVTGNNQRFDDIVINFSTDDDGTGVLLLVVENGDWRVSDIRTTSDNDPGYTPNYTRLKTLVPTAHKANNQISFKTEYYNVAGVKSKQISYIYNKSWEGGNRYIDGNYSMLTGSLYVADTLETGVAISGYKNTGFVRSLGYQGFEAGFPGFLLWSGSALSGSLGTKGGNQYSGVGLELYATTSSYFRYSTTDSEIDVRTDKFFFGNPATSFISGSNGNMQFQAKSFLLGDTASQFISGSNGNLQMRAKSFILGDTASQFISGSNGNMQIRAKSFILGDTASQFISGSNGLIEISSSKFSVSTAGELLATEGTFRGVNQADLFAYRNIDIDGSYNNQTTYTGYDTKTYCALNLTGSRVAGIGGSGPSLFIRVSAGSYPDNTYPIGNINIHDASFYNPSSQFQQVGAIVVIEAGTNDIYLAVSSGSLTGGGTGATQGYGGTGASALNSDSTIAVDGDDMIHPMVGTHILTGGGGTYINAIKVQAGAQVVLAQSKFAWRIVALSSYDSGRVQFAGGLVLKNVTTTVPAAGSGIVYKDASGFLKIA